jgi:GrpB-like predicted nucleotidyltransferase (UPF0157 family)
MKFYETHHYQPKVYAIFNQLKLDLERSLTDARIEHIGSSAINGAISKGDLDVFVGVSRDRFEKSLEIIKGLEFIVKEGTLRTESLCMLVTEKYQHDVAIQLSVNGSEFEDFIRFRDILNQSPMLVDEYNTLKRESEGMEPNAYRAKKRTFIEQVLTFQDGSSKIVN